MSYTNEKEIVVLYEVPAVPDDHENGECNANAEYLDNAMKK
jgi:hypothetical protein